MPAPVPACRCGWLVPTSDPKSGAKALWRHIDEAHPLPDRAELARSHKGRFVWRNPAESVWECDDDCPHPSHEEQP